VALDNSQEQRRQTLREQNLGEIYLVEDGRQMFIVIAINALWQIVLHQLLHLLLIQVPAVVIVKGSTSCRVWSSCSSSSNLIVLTEGMHRNSMQLKVSWKATVCLRIVMPWWSYRDGSNHIHGWDNLWEI